MTSAAQMIIFLHGANMCAGVVPWQWLNGLWRGTISSSWTTFWLFIRDPSLSPGNNHPFLHGAILFYLFLCEIPFILFIKVGVFIFSDFIVLNFIVQIPLIVFIFLSSPHVYMYHIPCKYLSRLSFDLDPVRPNSPSCSKVSTHGPSPATCPACAMAPCLLITLARDGYGLMGVCVKGGPWSTCAPQWDHGMGKMTIEGFKRKRA